MVQYKWVALSNTTLGVLMATINGTITLISLPAIFRGIHLNPFASGSFIYLLWILMGFNIVTAVLLVTFGRLSDIFGRVRLFNIGFAIFTFGSVMLYLTPGSGDTAAQFLVAFRIVQGIGASFLFSNSSAIITDAFPVSERGKALGINQVAALGGSFIGLILGGILSVINWRFVFLVSVPVGAIGTVWSMIKLKDTALKEEGQKIDYVGNIVFGSGLTVLLVAITYGLLPYGNSTTGWSNPLVVVGIVLGVFLLALFPVVERYVKQPMFKLKLFRNRAFAAGNFASLLSAVGRGGVMLMLVILLQGIWLPLHGYSYSSTPFWAGIFMLPMTAGFMIMGPLSGTISDRHGARVLATGGMVIVGLAFLILSLFPYDFNYLEFGITLFVMGMGNGMFAAPNTAAIMNSVPAESRGAASGMMTTLRNAGQTASMGMFFTIVIIALSSGMGASFTSALSSIGVSNASLYGAALGKVPPTIALFSAFLGENPMTTIIAGLPASMQSGLSPYLSTITGKTWFPMALAPAFMGALRDAFYVGMVLSFVAAIVSLLRGRKYVDEGAKYVAEINADNSGKGERMIPPGEGSGDHVSGSPRINTSTNMKR